MKHYDRVWATVNISAIINNMELMKEHLGEHTRIIAVVKTDAYGHGAVIISRELEKTACVHGFATATMEEAVILRRSGIKKPILLLGTAFPYGYDEIIAEDITITVFQLSVAEALSELAIAQYKKCKVHIKIDTGMNRVGIFPDEEGFLFMKKAVDLQGLEIEGIFTHFAKSDEANLTSTRLQLSIFNDFVKRIEDELKIRIPYKHCSNSGAILGLKESNLDLVRAGIILYGLWPSDEVDKEKILLEPALSLKSHIVYLKTVEANQAISYGGLFTTKMESKIATVPVGYGDGYPRGLSNKGFMLVRGQRAPIVGRVCMDQCMIDVTHILDVCEGDEVVLIGHDGRECITAEEIGVLSGRFNYELVCNLGKRIPRVYSKAGVIIGTKDYFSDYY